jgi:hypothetical protein
MRERIQKTLAWKFPQANMPPLATGPAVARANSMKNFAIGILFLGTILFGGLYVSQRQKTSRAEAAAAELRQQLDDREAEFAKQEKLTASLRNRLGNTRVEVEAKALEAANLQQALTNQIAAAQTNSKPSNPLAEMFKNPEMMEMIKKQQRAGFDRNFDRNYARLCADLQMSPEQIAAFKELLWKKQSTGAELGMSLLSQDLDAAKRTELVQQMKTDREAINAEIKQFLGDDNYAQYEAYEKTQRDRGAVSGFKKELPDSMPLNSDQEQQLMGAMTEERKGFKFTSDLADESKFDGDFTSRFSEESIARYFQELDQLNQQYLARARGILSEEQFAAYQKYLTHQQEMQKMGMQMAAKMFGAKTGSGGAAAGR